MVKEMERETLLVLQFPDHLERARLSTLDHCTPFHWLWNFVIVVHLHLLWIVLVGANDLVETMESPRLLRTIAMHIVQIGYCVDKCVSSCQSNGCSQFY